VPDDVATEPANKRACLNVDNATNNFFGEMFTAEATMDTPRDNQLDEYLQSPASTTQSVTLEAKGKSMAAAMQCSSLGAPAASTSLERSFSIAGLTAEEHCCQLKSSTVDELVFLHGLSKRLIK